MSHQFEIYDRLNLVPIMPFMTNQNHLYRDFDHLFTCFVSINSENDITGHLHNTFAVEQHSFGELREHELRPGGGEEEVTEANKKEYVR